jgi:hypothetical protein
VPFQGEAYVAWLEKSKKLNALGDEFEKVANK